MNVPTSSTHRPSVAPPVVLAARIGDRTVGAAVDSAVRIRFDGDGPRATAPIVAESAAARKLLASPAGADFEHLLRTVAASANRNGERADDLQTISFTPDLDAIKGVRMVNAALRAQDEDGVSMTHREANATAREIDASSADYLSGTLAWNSGGHIVMTPDISRTLLATVGAYKPTDGDDLALPWTHAALFTPGSDVVREGTLAQRGNLIKEALLAATHERQHSDTPPVARRESEATAAIEEATAEVLGVRSLGNVTRSIGGSLQRIAAKVDTQEDRGGLGWRAWNRDDVHAPDSSEAAHIHRTYVDGPKTLRSLLKLTGIDLRTTEGHATATDILQGKQAMFAARRLADAIRTNHGIADDQRNRFADLVRGAFTLDNGLRTLREHL